MAKGPRYCVSFRRRREGKTDYKARKALLLSEKPRLVIRGSLKNITVQIIAAKPGGDEVMTSAHSRELTRNYGWKASRGNIPAAYLTGLLCGLKAKAKGVKEAILDIGLDSPVKGSRIFAALKGVTDAQVDVPHSEDKFSEKERIEGKHIANYAETLSAHPEEHHIKFSKYMKQKLPPQKLPKHFAKVKKEMTNLLAGGERT